MYKPSEIRRLIITATKDGLDQKIVDWIVELELIEAGAPTDCKTAAESNDPILFAAADLISPDPDPDAFSECIVKEVVAFFGEPRTVRDLLAAIDLQIEEWGDHEIDFGGATASNDELFG